jgi:hypothetical protein
MIRIRIRIEVMQILSSGCDETVCEAVVAAFFYLVLMFGDSQKDLASSGRVYCLKAA